MSIADAYADATVLVTGATGFVGKGLVEKILRTCRSVRQVLVLIRARRGQTADQRLERLKKDVVFDRLRASDPDALDKLAVVSGDIGVAPAMGLSGLDEQRLIDCVSIVLHSAATVSFGLPFEATSNLNVLGTKRLLDLSRKMRNLKSFVYVSTAYTGILSRTIEEKIHPAKKPIDMDRFLQVLSAGKPEEMLREAYQYQDAHPNMYTLSKFFAEHLIDHYFRRYAMPISIVRPSIISGAAYEPTPGWVDNFNGNVGLCCEIARGGVGTIFANGDIKVDAIPIDLVCHLILVAAWWTARNPSRSELRIYNQTTLAWKPFTVDDAFASWLRCGRLYPSQYTTMYPSVWTTRNRLVHKYCQLIYLMLPALLVDLRLRIGGRPPLAWDLARKFTTQIDASVFFVTHEFEMRNDNVARLIAASKSAVDHGEFHMDVRPVNLRVYNTNLWLGVRRFLLKEKNVPLVTDPPVGRAKMRLLYWISWIYIALQVLAIGGLIWLLARSFA